MVVNNGGILSSSVQIQVLPAQPGVFLVNGQGVVLHSNFSYITSKSPASRGEEIIIYCTGLGAVSPQVEAGFAAPAAPLASTAKPVVMIGGVSAEVAFSGLAPGLAGLYQLNVIVPENAPGGSSQMTISAGGISSSPVALAIQVICAHLADFTFTQ